MSVTLHTSKGDIKLELFCSDTPRSTANFLALCASSKYNGSPFHRIIPEFIIQTGDPTGTGKTSRAAFAKRLPDEASDIKFDQPGMVAFANSGKMSGRGVGSQFFITLVEAPHLDGTCTIVGKVIDGMKVVDSIGKIELKDGNPVEKIVVKDVTIHANPIADGSIKYEYVAD